MRRSLIAWTLTAALGAAVPTFQPALAAPVPEQPPTRAGLGDLVAPDASGRRPAQAAWSPDGKRLAYVWDEKGDSTEKLLWTLDIANGKREVVLRPADLKDPKDSKDSKDGKLEIDDYSWSPKGDSLLVVAGGDLYLESLADHGVRRLTRTKTAEEDPRFSPDGRRIAFVRGFDLYVLDVASSAETRLTSDGQENVALNGTNDWVYGEEIWNRQPEGFWWSPDGSRIAFYHFDETPVGVYSLVDDTPLYPKVMPQKYPKSGEPNPRVKVGVVDAGGGKTTWLGTGDTDSYPARVGWTPKGDAVAVQRLSRDQKHLDLLRCGAADGACSPLISETWHTWINLGRDFHFLPDGRFLWGSERDGWRRLYLYGADGRSGHPVTPEGWAVTALDGVADDGSWAVVTVFPTSELGAVDRKVAKISLKAGGGWEILTPEPGSHSGLVSPRTGSWVHTWSDADTPARSEVRPAGGGQPIALPSAGPKFDAASLPKWEIFTIPGPDGSRLPARLLKPAGFDPSHRYPVIIYHYGGPGSQVVDNAWNVRSLWHKLMAQRGFVVFSVDNQSSTFFGKAGEDKDYRRFGTVNLAGQLAGVDYLKTLPWVDASRLGLWGWSGGGSNTLYCVLNRPGVWKAAIAGAPVTDWRLYDSIWTERYLDRPQDNADGYRDSSPITYTANLKDHLLVVHGLADDNVHPQNSINLSGDFVKAGVPFEQAFYPGQKHGFRGSSSRHFYERATEFFERELTP
ncbi:MAG TPA: DPP IV N-terminal domain-containing protein [Thermoanaerobaculia bacterium]|jgi:dipeptidyl-peptidase-4|nr:DPP IV N-terminal domain-containing protein [Thermoanaerobaculia bacterium]